MGGISLTRARSLQRFFPNFHAQDWQQVPMNKLEGQSRFGEYTTLRNKITKQQIDRYHLTFYSDKQQRIYEQCFMQRLRQQYLVNAFHYEPLKNQGICSSIRGAVVYIQHILIRLSDITDIPIDQSLYITKCALYGFQKLYNQSGYFQVMEEHIGIDKEGRVRVWLNADVSKNYPSGFEEDSVQSRDNEKTMVAQIITMIQKNTSLQAGNPHQDDNHDTPISISAFMEKNHTRFPSFREAQELIRQYALKYQIQIPKHCRSVVEIFQQDYGEDFNLTNASSFGENLDIGGNQLFQEERNSERYLQNPINLNMTSSRSRTNTPHVLPINNGDRPNSFLRQNEGNLESRQQSYKQYEPTSIYRPNEKSKRISIADDNGPYVQVIKPESQTSSIHSQRHSLNGSQHASQQNYNQSHHSHNRSHSHHTSHNHHTQSMHGSGYNLGGSQYSNRFQIRVLQQPISGNKSLSPIDIAGLTQLGQDRRLPRLKQQQNAKLRQSRSSYSKMSKQSSRIHQNPSIPKITFNYVNRNELINSDRISSVLPVNSHTELNSVNYSQRNALEQNQNVDTDRQVELQLQKDIQKQLQFTQGIQNRQQNRLTFDPSFKKKSDTYQDAIAQSNQDQIDPQIMRDLLKQFPSFQEDKENHHF